MMNRKSSIVKREWRKQNQQIRNRNIRNKRNGSTPSPTCKRKKVQRIFLGILNDISCGNDGVFREKYTRLNLKDFIAGQAGMKRL